MKNKVSFFILIISLIAIALGGILYKWVMDSYTKSIENFKLTTEKSLFDAVQKFAQEKNSATHPSIPLHFKENITKQYALKNKPQDLEGIIALLDSAEAMNMRNAPKHMQAPPKDDKNGFHKPEPKFLAPLFLRNIQFEASQDSLKLKNNFDAFLASNDISTAYSLQFERLNHKGPFDPQLEQAQNDSGLIQLRPFSINPEKQLFIKVTFDYPWSYIMNSLLFQIIVSIFVFCVVIGSLVYLLLNLWKQYQLDNMRKSFINSLTHELRTPITTVYAALDSLHSHINDRDLELREAYYSMAFEELEHLNNMITKVLTIAETDRDDKNSIQLKTIDIGAILTEITKNLQLTKGKENIYISCEVPSHIIQISADVNHIRSVINNLLDNALKYGSTKIWVNLEDDILHQKININIHDNGAGIAQEYQKQIFKPFFRVPQGDLYSVKGFGLGLSYVKDIIEKHDGSISLKSTPGLGTKFTITLPKNNQNND